MTISFRDFQNMHNAATIGRARKYESDMIMTATWDGDIQSQTAYLYDYFHDKGEDKYKLNDLHPQNDENKVAIPIKFIRHSSQTYSKDYVTFWLQLLPGQECNVAYYDEYVRKYGSVWPVGLYIDICDESEKYNRWLVVNTANYNQDQFPTWELLRCDYVFQWIHKGKKCVCPGVLRSQNSYNSGLWTDLNKVPCIGNNVWKNFLNCWKLLRANILNRKDEICLNANVEKLLDWTISSQALTRGRFRDYVV